MSLIRLKNNALDNLTSFEGSASLGDMVLVSSATASSSASIEFTLGNYKEYKFFFVNLHPSNNAVQPEINFSTDNGSNYNVIKTTTTFRAYHRENDVDTALSYTTGEDLAQSTAFQQIANSLGNGDDESCSGFLHLFNPSSTTFVKHFMSRASYTNSSEPTFQIDYYLAGYANTTSALTNIKFQMSSGNIDDGKILMFGLN